MPSTGGRIGQHSDGAFTWPSKPGSIRCRRLSWIAAFLALGLGFGQTPQAPRAERERQGIPLFTVESNLVVVDVTVRDRQGNLVQDLQKDDFTAYEDNVPQQIVTFSLEKIPVATSGTLAEAVETGRRLPIVNLQTVPPPEVKKEELEDKRLVILFFDLSSLGTEELIRSVEAAQEFVGKQTNPHDLLAVATFNSTLQLVQDLTNDREVLVNVLKQLSPTDAGDRPAEDLGDPDTSDETFVPDDVQFNIFNTDRRLSALEIVARMYAEFPVRKSLIYFSSGVTTTGTENDSQIRFAVDAANRSNMSIYTVDSRGLVALPPGGDATRAAAAGRAMFSGAAVQRQAANLSSSQETLTTLAHDTGGTAFQDTNDFGQVFAKVLDDTRTYYVVGYYSSNQKQDGRFRKIRVEVRRPELKVQNRPGYFAAKQFTSLTPAERDRQLEEALSVDRPFSEVPFILEADCFKTDGPNNLVPLTIQIAGDSMKFEEKGDRREGEFEFLAQIADSKGKVAGVARDNVQVRLPSQKAERLRSGQILYTTGFQLRPGDYRLKFLVRDNRTGKLGSFEQSLAVPLIDGKTLQTSSVVLGSRLVPLQENPGGIRHVGPGARFEMPGGGRDPLAIEGKRLVPSIGNVFLGRQTLYIYFQVYGAAEDPETRKPHIEASMMLLCNRAKALESQPQVFTDWTKDTKETVTLAMAVPLRNLKKADYTLQIHVRDAISNTNLYRRLPVVIE